MPKHRASPIKPAPKPNSNAPSRSSGLPPFFVSLSGDGPRSIGLPLNAILVSMDTMDTSTTFNYDSGVTNPSAGSSPEDPDYIGPKTRVFSKDMPGQWRQLLMGFMDWGSDDDEEFSDLGSENGQRGWEVLPREEYVRMWITCDAGLYMERYGGVLDRVESVLERLEKRETRFVRAGAARKRVDDILEYAVRLATGARVLKDEDAAFRMLTRIAKGPYPRDKAALAYNMLCYLYKKWFSREAVLENLIGVLVFGDLASSYGPFTHCVCTLACFFAPLKDLEPYKAFESLWTSYDEYRERWGLMLPGQKCCAVCGTVPEKKRELKKCAGSCLIMRKPLYCGKVCQRKHWSTHKQWCSRELTVTSSDIESDQYYSGYDSEDDYDSEEDENSEDDHEEWEDDDLDDEAGRWYATDQSEEEDEGSCEDSSPDCPRKHQGDDDCDSVAWYVTSVEDEGDPNDSDFLFGDARSPRTAYKHVDGCRFRSREQNRKRNKLLWNDYGDCDPEGFVMDIARSVVRLRNA